MLNRDILYIMLGLFDMIVAQLSSTAQWPIVGFDATSARFDGVDVTYKPDGDPIEVVSRHGKHPIWTRKTPVRVTGRIDGIDIDSRGLVDESAGHHARVTRWSWSAGCGTSDTGAALTWNLVDGVHDSPVNSERTLWVDGVPQELERLAFAPDLSRVGDLEFHAESERARHDRLILIDSKYRQPFGTFTGSIAGVTLREGYTVMVVAGTAVSLLWLAVFAGRARALEAVPRAQWLLPPAAAPAESSSLSSSSAAAAARAPRRSARAAV